MPSTAHRSFTHEPRSPDTGAYSVGVAVVHSRAPRGRAPRGRVSPTDEPRTDEPRSGWFARLPERLFGGMGRMTGVDVTRGLAVAGVVFGAFAYPGGSVRSGVPSLWLAAVGLVTAALFMVVAGVSVSVALRGPARGAAAAPLAEEERLPSPQSLNEHPPTLPALVSTPDAALGVAVRAALLFALGAVAAALGGTVAPWLPVLLQSIGALLFCALFVQRWRARTLFVVAALSCFALPTTGLLLRLVEQAMSMHPLADTPAASAVSAVMQSVVPLLTSSAFPVLTWCGPFIAGLAIGRLPVDRLWRPFTLLAVGGALTALAWGGAAVVELSTMPSSRLHGLFASRFSAPGSGPDPLSSITASASTVDVVGACGVALTLLALCVLLTRRLRWLLFPLSALGSLALTVSTALFAASVAWPALFAQPAEIVHRFFPTSVDDAAALGESGLGGSELVAFGLVVATLALAASIWRMLLAGGPLERGVSAVSAVAVRASLSRPRAHPHPGGIVDDLDPDDVQAFAESVSSQPYVDLVEKRNPAAASTDPLSPRPSRLLRQPPQSPSDARLGRENENETGAGPVRGRSSLPPEQPPERRHYERDEGRRRDERDQAERRDDHRRGTAERDRGFDDRRHDASDPQIRAPRPRLGWGASDEGSPRAESDRNRADDAAERGHYGARPDDAGRPERGRSRPSAQANNGRLTDDRTPAAAAAADRTFTKDRTAARTRTPADNRRAADDHTENPRRGRLFGRGHTRGREATRDDAEAQEHEPVASAGTGSAESAPPLTQWNPGRSLGRLPY